MLTFGKRNPTFYLILVHRVESNRASNRTGPLLDLIYRTEIPSSTRSNRAEPSRLESNRTVLGSMSHLWQFPQLTCFVARRVACFTLTTVKMESTPGF